MQQDSVLHISVSCTGMSVHSTYRTYGDPEVLRLEEAEVTDPGLGEVRVRNHLIGVNPVDWKLIAGMFRHTDPAPFPGVPGWASVGTIDATGADVDTWSVGQEVIVDSRARLSVTVGSRAGTYGDFVTVSTRNIVQRPPSIAPDQAAGLPSSGVAGYSMIDNLDLGPGDTVVVHGAAGGVGSAAVQAAIARGATVIGTASPANHAYLESLGAKPVDYAGDVVHQIQRIGTVTASADAIGGEPSVRATVALLGQHARAVTAWGDQHSEAAGIPWVHHPDDELEQTTRLAAEGALRIRIDDCLPLRDAAVALSRVQNGHSQGKLLLHPPSA